MFEKKVGKMYVREMMGSLAVYVIMLVLAIRFGRPLAEGALRTVVLASPMIGFGLAIWAIARHFGRIDEYMRQTLLESTAIGAAITCGLTFTYGFLETAGYPRLSMFTVWCVMCGATGAVCGIRALLKR
jgi:hypothetical protein